VRHCPDAAAVVLAHAPSGWSLAYSGDCRPSRAFARAARGVDVLVHEATFADDRRADAEAKRHCTAAEARRVVAEASARCGVLTHFSQRYPREQIPTSDEPRGGSGSEAGGGVVVAAGARVSVASAFDGMRVRWDGLDALDAVARRAGEMFAAREAERRGEAMEEG
jgi:ribonuclease Z